MKQGNSRSMLSAAGKAIRAASLLALLAAPLAMQAQTVTLYGTLSNMDVVNNTGVDVHGFEIEFQGVTGATSYYNWNRYGPPTVVPIPGGGGIYVRWMSPWDAATQTFVTGTPQASSPTLVVGTGHNCIQGMPFYATSGCEHFGLTTIGNPTAVIYRWMVADPNNPGQLITFGSTAGVPAPPYVQVPLPAPVWVVQPPAQPAQPVDIVAIIDPPVPPPPAKLYGEAQWMKTYKTEIARQANLDELVAGNPVVPEDAAQLETAWDLMQKDLTSNSKKKEKRGALGNGSQAVIRRLEFYKYTGAVDPVTGQALCADGVCAAPTPDEVGDFIGAQNVAANLNVPLQHVVAVTVVGDGQVSSSDRVILCPSGVCTESVPTHATVTLTAKNGKGIFAGWTGACTGTSLICTITVDSDAPTTATFLTPHKLTVTRNGSGTVTTDPTGSSFLDGTVVTITAAPNAGNTFTGWTGACSGTSLTCTVTMSADTTVTANFTGVVAPPPTTSTTYKLVVKLNGNGKVATSPTGSSFAAGTSVTLTATPGAGAPWIGWTGACTGTALTCTVAMNADTTVTANFR